jgi:selenide,water dikinase
VHRGRNPCGLGAFDSIRFDSPEPIYGLVAIDLVEPSRVIRNKTARAGDEIILTKRLGIGIYSAALKRQELDAHLYEEMVRSMTQLNVIGAEMGDIAGVHAMTDVTGFGLLGHLLEMRHGASLCAELQIEALPLLTRAQQLAEMGIGTGGAKRNWASYGHKVDLPVDAPEWLRGVSCDPQTSGGMLISCSSDSAPEVLELLRKRTFIHASVLGFSRHPAARSRSLTPRTGGILKID